MTRWEVSIDTQIDAAARLDDARRAHFMEAATRGFRISQERVSVDTGQLQRSGVPPVEREDGSVVWGYNADYAEGVEEGQEPHWPPIDPLLGWARRVLGAESAAYDVQQKIAEEGTPAQPFVEPGVDAMKAYMRGQTLKEAFEEFL